MNMPSFQVIFDNEKAREYTPPSPEIAGNSEIRSFAPSRAVIKHRDQ
jgi:hypothetical protein